ncbi:condensation domain-containing protein [Amycolatopsis magusensis]|uniref:Condensation domain-containing protein n=1 Tax=Amycolatopsis magusensis TaxID=882444 RepID=A0ABS4PNT8_9PSEU|nr:condensation domain-containing protein [Amycolatopsis magusensis]MBP2181075.1 hypothetical protein [Amycolatopsis magusensis]MDI5980907.1 condensation domain-containing protein [Amycolatopsis magusensis]
MSTAEDRIPLSLNQEFLCMWDQGDEAGPFGPKYNIIFGVRVTGGVDEGVLQSALDDVVVRHEALRTLVIRDEKYQKVLPPGQVPLFVSDLGDVPAADRQLRAEQFIGEIESGSYSAVELPLIRAFLGRFDGDDAVLVLIVHHTAADEWSMPLIMRDLAAFYAGRLENRPHGLADARQYPEYSVWEKQKLTSDSAAKSREFWAKELEGAQILPLKTHFPRSAGRDKTTAWHRFSIAEDLGAALLSTAKATRSSPFMVLLAAYNAFLHKLTGETDVVVMTFTSGRGEASFHDTVGAFFNYLPLRTDLSGCETFADVVSRTRRTCLRAYAQDIPFGEIAAQAPQLMGPGMADDGAPCAFQVFRSPFAATGDAGGFTYQEIRRRLLPQAAGGDIPDGSMWHIDMEFDGEMAGTLGFNTNLYDADGMRELAANFLGTLKNTVGAPDTPLDQI